MAIPKIAEVVGKYLQRNGWNVPYIPYFEKVQQYLNWYRGDTDWHEYRKWNGVKRVKRKRYSLDMAKTCCEDLTSLIGVEKIDFTFDETEAKEFCLKVLADNRFRVNAVQLFELMFALGSCSFVANFLDNQIKIDYIHGDLIFPLKWDNGELTECAFAIVGGDNENTAYQLITYTLNEQGNYVVKKINLDASGEIAKPVSQLGVALQTGNYAEEEWDTGSSVPPFRFCKTNIVNNYDKTSPLGMSVYGNAIDTLKAIDETFDSLNNEFSLGKKRIFIKSGLKAIRFENVEEFNNSIYRQAVDSNDVEFYQVDWAGEHEDKPPIYESNMTLRVAEHQQGMDLLLKLLSRKVGLGDGFYSFDGTNLARTATEVISVNSALFRNIRKQELGIEEVLVGLCRTILDLANRNLGTNFNVDQSITINFDDSIIEDTEKEKTQAMAEYNAGLIDQVEYFAITRRMTREQALKFVAEMEATDTMKQVESILNYGSI